MAESDNGPTDARCHWFNALLTMKWTLFAATDITPLSLNKNC